MLHLASADSENASAAANVEDSNEMSSNLKDMGTNVKPSNKRGGRKRKGKGRKMPMPGVRQNYELTEFDKSNDILFEYYKKQEGVIPASEWEQFEAILRVDLPSSFRIQLCLPERDRLAEYLQRNFFDKIDRLETALLGKAVHTPKKIAFIPYAYQTELHRAAMRSQPKSEESTKVLKDLHDFLVDETAIGTMSRQEAVSMVPPLLLDIQPNHMVLDACAAPGSKTMQIIELMHKDCANPDGLVVANDVDDKRCYLLVHQTLKRMPTANCVVINENAAQLTPIVDIENRPVPYDRILCDVICSSDGTFRKNPELWSSWTPLKALHLHKLQQQIAWRCLELMAVNGLMCYSTCSLNPIEDEAVLAHMLRTFKGKLELVDVSDRLPELKRCQGVPKWKVLGERLQEYSSLDEVPNGQRKLFVPSMFPPTTEEASWMHLERAFRILPHSQNSGGFFVALLRKTGTFGFVNKGVPLEVDGTQTAVVEQQADTKKVPPPRKRFRPGTFREDPFVFIGGDLGGDLPSELETHYGVDRTTFPYQNLLIRSHNTEKKKEIYFVNDRLREFLRNNANRFKIVNAGVGVLRKTADKKASPCAYRLKQDGLQIMIPFLRKRVIDIGKDDLIPILQTSNDHGNHYISLERLSCSQVFTGLDSGSIVLRVKTEDGFKKEICAWMGSQTIAGFVSREDKMHLLSMLGVDTALLRMTAKTKRQEKAEKVRKAATEGEISDSPIASCNKNQS